MPPKWSLSKVDQMLASDQLRPVDMFPNYAVTRTGTVLWLTARPRWKRAPIRYPARSVPARRYPTVHVAPDGNASRGTRKLLHRVVWEAFEGLVPAGYVVHHKDQNRLNAHIGNLALFTLSENQHIRGDNTPDTWEVPEFNPRMMRIRPVRDASAYVVSEYGHIVRVGPTPSERRRGHLLKQRGDKDGYQSVTLWHPQRETYTAVRVHHLVLHAYDRPRRDGEIVRHLNGDPEDNRVENLRWGTHLENEQDAFDHGTRIAGETHPLACKPDQVVRELIARYRSGGVTLPELADEFEVSVSTAHNWVKGHTRVAFFTPATGHPG